MRRRFPSGLALPAAILIVVLALGLWIGGRHPGWLPGPVRSVFVGDDDTAVVREAIDRVHDTYYREIPKSQLSDDAIAGIVSKLGDRFSNYFSPAEYKRFKQTQNSEFSGVGLQVSSTRSACASTRSTTARPPSARGSGRGTSSSPPRARA